MDVGWWQILVLGGSSGVLAGFVNQGAGLVRDLFAANANTRERDLEREHQQQLRREEAHAAARETYLVHATGAIDYLQAQFFWNYGPEVGMQMIAFPDPVVTDRVEIMAGLRKIAREHPSAAVRAIANDVFTDLINHYNEPATETEIPLSPRSISTRPG